MRRVVPVIGVVIAVLLGAAAFALTRPRVEATSSAAPAVTIRCDAAVGTVEACRAWGDAILAHGAPSHTFEMEDLVELRIRSPLFGLGSRCEVDYVVGRYPDDPVWDEEVACADG